MASDPIVLGAIWFTPHSLVVSIFPDVCIGVVAVESDTDGHWKCYIGYGMGSSEQADAASVAHYGMPLGNRDAAAAFFPSLDKEKFRY